MGRTTRLWHIAWTHYLLFDSVLYSRRGLAGRVEHKFWVRIYFQSFGIELVTSMRSGCIRILSVHCLSRINDVSLMEIYILGSRLRREFSAKSNDIMIDRVFWDATFLGMSCGSKKKKQKKEQTNKMQL